MTESSQKKFLLFLAILIPISLLLNSYWNHYSFEKKLLKKITPIKNPNPKYFLDFRVHADKQLQNDLPIILMFGYTTTNPSCMKTINELEGVKRDREIIIKRNAKFDKNGNYNHKFIIDKYLPGTCGWQAAGFSYKIPGTDIEDTPAIFSNQKNDKSFITNALDTIQCTNSKQCDYLPKKSNYFSKYKIYINENYKYFINII